MAEIHADIAVGVDRAVFSLPGSGLAAVRLQRSAALRVVVELA